MPAPSPRDPFRLRVAQLNRRQDHSVDLRPDAEARAALAAEFGLLALPALQLQGALRIEGTDGWRFAGRLVADVVQPCVVSLQPVPAHLEEDVTRVWSPDLTGAEPGGGEVEMGDETLEPLAQFIDLGAVLAEELSLALPSYPRAAGVALPQDEAPQEDRRRPFADLDRLLARKSDQH